MLPTNAVPNFVTNMCLDILLYVGLVRFNYDMTSFLVKLLVYNMRSFIILCCGT